MTTETPLDLKSTVNLPKTNFPQKASLAEREPHRLARWKEINLYSQIKQVRSGHPIFVLHDGPPYANADIHIGTAMNKIVKDFIVKSHSMMGFDAPYVPGYDCHGLPIENFVDKKLKEQGLEKAKMSALEFRRVCREHASESLKGQTRDFMRLGILGEWDDPYLTMSNAYEAETARLFGRFIERGYVYRGLRPVYWCINDQTALAEAEIEYKAHTSPSVYVKFPFPADQVAALEKRLSERGIAANLIAAGKPVYALIWTTTPWTLPANVGIAAHPGFDYAAVDAGNEIYILANDLVETVAEACGLGELRRLAVFPGVVLDRLHARHAWADRPSLMMLADYVTLGDAEMTGESVDGESRGGGKAGTGLVHTAPGHGHEDFLTGQQYKEELRPVHENLGVDVSGEIVVYCPVANDGRFTSEVEHFAGMRVFDANQPIVDFMRKSGALLHDEKYEHRYPTCWRCHKPLVFRATPQWFISMDNARSGGTTLRAGALREVERVEWIPEWGRIRMHNMFAKRPDWCVSRQRLWGVPIPVFHCAACNHPIADAAVVDHVASIFERESSDAWYSRDAAELVPAGYVCPKCAGSHFVKESDILDVWFDSGSSSMAVLEHERHLPWPADVYSEGPDQYRGWFNSSLMVGLAAHDQAPYKTVITHGWTVDGDGRAMHKHLGNVIPPDKIINASGAEILRLWVASSNYKEDLRLSDEILKRLIDAYRKIRNTARYALGNLADFDPETDRVAADQLLEIDRWALAATDEVIHKAVEAYKRFDYHVVYHLLYNYCTVTLSALYFDVLKDRLYTFAPKSAARRSAQSALLEIVEKLALLSAPILAFTADEIWEHIPGVRSVSVHLEEFPKPRARDSELLARWERLFEVRSAVQKALEERREAKVIGASLEAKVTIRAGGETLQLLEQYAESLPAILIVSETTVTKGKSDEVEVEVEHADGAKCERCWNWSTTVGQNSKYPMLDARCVRQLEEGWGR